MDIEQASFPIHSGSYILILHLERVAQLTIGKLGHFTFATGSYAYVGSAFGAGGLRGRLKHHLAPLRKAHWHIDYLRVAARVCEVWWVASEQPYEHAWARTLWMFPGAQIPVPRFGASDCQCASHLVYVDRQPAYDALCSTMAEPLMRVCIPG